MSDHFRQMHRGTNEFRRAKDGVLSYGVCGLCSSVGEGWL